MKLITQPVIKLSDEEKTTLRKADEIITEILDALANNTAQGFAAFQEGLNAPESFWSIYHHCLQIENEQLIP